MQVNISWFLKKATDLDLHCLQRQGIYGFSKTRVKVISQFADDSETEFKHFCFRPESFRVPANVTMWVLTGSFWCNSNE